MKQIPASLFVAFTLATGCPKAPSDYPSLAAPGDLGLVDPRTGRSVESVLSPHKNIDVLFVIDNSTSMAPKQNDLAQHIPTFIQRLHATDANYHIAVTTSDVGSLPTPASSWNQMLGITCETFAGDDGKFRRQPCTMNQFYTEEGATACKRLCPDPSFVPQDGKGYISRENGVTNVPKDLVAGVDVGPLRAFQCLALVGDTGCGLEGTLEASKRALDGHNPQNQGFLRTDSTLAVIFVTDEDDCSVQATRRTENDPALIECTPGNKDAAARCFNPDYRCLARSLRCTESLDIPGQKSNCSERADSYLESVNTYVHFFSALRPKHKLLLSGLWTPPIDKGGKLVTVQKDASKAVGGLNRGDDAATAACTSKFDNRVLGKPQVRLSRFAGQFPGSIETSICDTANYPKALDSIIAAIESKAAAQCLDGVPLVQDGKPACVVLDVAQNEDAGTPFGACSSACCDAWASTSIPESTEPSIRAACAAEAATPCYCVVPSKAGACSGGAVIGVWRKDAVPPPADKRTKVRCSIAG